MIQTLLRNKMEKELKRKVEQSEKSIGTKSRSSKALIPREVDLYHQPQKQFHQKDQIVRSHQLENSR